MLCLTGKLNVNQLTQSMNSDTVYFSLKPKDIEQLIEYSQECSQEITFKCVQQGNVTNEGTVFR